MESEQDTRQFFRKMEEVIRQQQADIIQLQQARDSSQGRLPFKPIKPEFFDGSSKPPIDAWLFQLDQYNASCPMKETSLILFATTLLRDHALQWWRTRLRQEERQGQNPLESWEEFKEIITTQFKQFNSVKIARDKMATLKQTTSVMAYAHRFRQLVNEIPSMTDEDDLVDRFLRGLKLPIRRSVEMHEPETLDKAMRLAERHDNISQHQSNRDTEWKQPFFSQRYNKSPDAMEIDAIGFGKLTDKEREILKQKRCCFYCRKPGHVAQLCPAKGRNKQHPLNSESQQRS